MTNDLKLPTPADKIVSEFVDRITGIEPSFIQGVYLTGSLSQNDFQPAKSDIDFLVLCKKLPEGKVASVLEEIHKSIKKIWPQPVLSGCYLASDSIQTTPPENIKVLSWDLGYMRYGSFEMGPVSLTELNQNAITLFGPKAESLPVNISSGILNKFLLVNINTYWTRWINKYSAFFGCKVFLLLFPKFTEWSILGVARQLCTLKTGKIVSKSEAGTYCLNLLPDKFHPIIQEAINIRKNNRTLPPVSSYLIEPSFKRASQTIACVNYIIQLFNKEYKEKVIITQTTFA